jgi:hypothetical protein
VKRRSILWALCAFLISPACVTQTSTPLVFLWAGEHAEDFRFLEPGKYGIVYRSGTIVLEGDRSTAIPRTEPIFLPVQGTLHSAVRIETRSAVLSSTQRPEAVRQIVELTSPQAVTGVIVDFEAVPEERTFYRTLLEDLRARLPASKPLSIMAPIGWCTGDSWIAGLPIEQAIPRLLAGDPPAGQDMGLKLCRSSYALRSDAQPPRPGRRLYYVHAAPWNEQAVARLR